jgi:hypothetical protein
MGKVESIEREVQQLSPTELAAFRAWFIQFDSDTWDRQIKQDAQDGKLDALAEAALAEFHAGQCKPL